MENIYDISNLELDPFFDIGDVVLSLGEDDEPPPGMMVDVGEDQVLDIIDIITEGE
jgi:hypothetical protein